MSATLQNPNQSNGHDATGTFTYDGEMEYLYDGDGRICAISSTPVPGTSTLTGYLYDPIRQQGARGLDFETGDSPAMEIHDYDGLRRLCNSSEVSGSRSTGKERDAESGNDYFGARYYASSMGRFMSPDWSAKEEPVPYAKLDDPQSLNLYAYVLNNPLSKADPDGHCPECIVWADELVNSPEGQAATDYVGAAVAAGVATAGAWLTSEIGVSGNMGFGGQYGDFHAQAPANALQSKDASASSADSTAKPQGPVKAADAPTVTSSGQAANPKTGEKLGPSGRETGHSTTHNTKKGAKEAAAKSSKDGKVRNDANPKDGRGGHFHPNDTDNEASEHHYYPKKSNP